MWFPVISLLLVGVAIANSGSGHEHAWETENEYQYSVFIRTLAGVDKLKQQYTGIQLKGALIIQVKSPESLQAKYINPRYAHIHQELPNGPYSKIPEENLEYRNMPMSGKPFEIKLKHGVIRDLLFDRNVPTWEVNMLKGIVGQLQIDTQGENAMDSKSTQIPFNEPSSATFKAMEDSVGGKCEVLYEITPLPQHVAQTWSDRVPMPSVHSDGHHYEVKKLKNYEKCQERQLYHYGMDVKMTKENMMKRDKVFSEISTTHVIITGNLKSFTIQSTEMKNEITVQPETSPIGTVYSITKLTLAKKSKISHSWFGPLELSNVESTGNLVYTFNNPFSDSENRRVRQPSISRNSEQENSSELKKRSSSASSSSSSSSSSSEEENESVMQSKASVQNIFMAPNVPLLPYFIGFKGKTVMKSDKQNVMQLAKDLLIQIAKEIQYPSEGYENTLEKYLNLKNLIRTMDRKQYAELEQYVSQFNKETVDGENAWYTLRDAVVHAGTGPAFVTIENWLKNGQVKGEEAAGLLSKIPKSVQQPTPDYIKAFFELISTPIVTQQVYVNVSAPLAFAELLRNNYVVPNHYPIHSFGRMTLKGNEEIVDKYISYLGNQLQQGYLENNTQKIQTFIFALGITAHPKIISVFEPYLESKLPTSKYQRMLMVAALADLARDIPKLVGPIFYKLYMNENEAHEVRCMAVHQFILTDPPMITLQRVAKYTNYDQSDQVNSAVKSTLNSIINTKRPEWRNLANKARSVRYLVNRKNYDTWYSKGYYIDFEDWIVKGLNVKTIASNDAILPRYVYVGVDSIFNFLRKPTFEVGYAVSSYRQVYDLINELWSSYQFKEMSEKSQGSRVEKLAQELKIKSGQQNNLEGHVLFNSVYGSTVYPYDKHRIREAVAALKELLTRDSKLKTTAFNNFEKVVSFPMEMGVPFVYSLEMPVLVKTEIDFKKGEPITSRTGLFETLFCNKVQKRFGFIAPFEHQNYIAGIDKNGVMRVPLEYEANIDRNQKNFALKIRPNIPQSEMSAGLKHYSVVPFTARQNIFNLQPVSKQGNMRLVITSEIYKTTKEQDPFSIKIESDTTKKESVLKDIVTETLKSSNSNNERYMKIDTTVHSNQIAKCEIQIDMTFDGVTINGKNHQTQSSQEEMQHYSKLDWKPNSKERREQIINILSGGLRSGTVFVADVSLSLPKLPQNNYVFTVGSVRSNIDQRLRHYVYANTHATREVKYELCYSQEVQYAYPTPLNLEYALNNESKDKLKAILRYGRTCDTGSEVVINASSAQSQQLKDMIENSSFTKQCIEEIQKGKKSVRACNKATDVAQVRDQLNFHFHSSHLSEIRQKYDQVIGRFKHLNLSQSNVQKDSETNTIVVKNPLIMAPAVQQPWNRWTIISSMDITTLPHLFNSAKSTSESQWQSGTDALLDEVSKPSCTLDDNKILTFDNQLYDVQLGKCKHVLLTTYPQDSQNRRNYIPESSKVAVLAEDTDNNSRNVYVWLGNQEIELKKVGNKLEVAINGQNVEIPERGHQETCGNEIIFEIVKLPDGSLSVISEKYGISVIYDGKHVRIYASGAAYRNAIRGLCGNYDSRPNNDFLTPKNCLLTKPEEFAATYAITNENCQGPAPENKRKAEGAMCIEVSEQQQMNVISDREAGRMMTEGKNWGYHQANRKKEHGQDNKRGHGHKKYNQKNSQEGGSNESRYTKKHNIVYNTRVVEIGDEICFTTTPVPICRQGTRPTERNSKKYNLYCLPRNNESMDLKRRVEEGAKPDFTQKPVNKLQTFQVPVSCSAA